MGSRLSTSRWLDAVWEPSAKIHVLPGGLDMLDVSGDGEARLIVADLGTGTTDSAKVGFAFYVNRIGNYIDYLSVD